MSPLKRGTQAEKDACNAYNREWYRRNHERNKEYQRKLKTDMRAHRPHVMRKASWTYAGIDMTTWSYDLYLDMLRLITIIVPEP